MAGGNYGTRKVSDYTVDELQQLKQHFVQCAKRAEKAGFDGIQLHLAHGYLLSKFLSPKTNTRTDRYGFAQGKACPALLSKCFRNFAHSFLNSFTSVRKCTAVTLKQME